MAQKKETKKKMKVGCGAPLLGPPLGSFFGFKSLFTSVSRDKVANRTLRSIPRYGSLLFSQSFASSYATS
jgi:hypothetical protein